MKKRFAVLMLLVCAVLCWGCVAQADTTVSVSDYDELLTKLKTAASGTTIDFTGVIPNTAETLFTVPAGVTLRITSGTTVEKNEKTVRKITVSAGATLELNADLSGSTYPISISNSGTLQGSGKVKTVNNQSTGTVKGNLTISTLLRNEGGLVEGNIVVDGMLKNITSGSPASVGKVTGGTFNGLVINESEISGGTFSNTVENTNGGSISNGTFYSDVVDVVNENNGKSGTITGGVFYGNVTDDACYIITLVVGDDDGYFGKETNRKQSCKVCVPKTSTTITVGTGWPTLTKTSSKRFQGWIDESDTIHKEGSNLTITGDTTLTAIFVPETITITLNANGGTFDGIDTRGWTVSQDKTSISKLVEYGITIIEDVLPKPTRGDDWEFKDWQKESTNNEDALYSFDFTTPITEDLTLNAQWKKLYTISIMVTTGAESGTAYIYKPGDTTPYTSVNVPTGTKLSLVFTPGEGGYVLNEIKRQVSRNPFSEDSEGNMFYTVLECSDTVNVSFGFPVTFHSNGGKVYGGRETREVTCNRGHVLDDGDQKDAYRSSKEEEFSFAGWYTEKTGGTKVIFGNSSTGTTGNITVTQPMVIYAHWEYNVTFNPGEGGSGTMAAQTFTEGTPAPLNECTFARDGYVFAGWKVQGGDDTTYADKATFSSATGDVTLVAQWKKLYTVKIAVDKNSTGTGTALIYLSAADRENGVNGQTEVTVAEGTDVYLKAVPADIDTRFDEYSWTENNEPKTNTNAEVTYAVNGNTTISAKFDKELLVTFDANGGMFCEDSVLYQVVGCGEKIDWEDGLLVELQRDGYDLDGWTYKGEDFDPDTLIKEHITLKAKWKLGNCLLTLHPCPATNHLTDVTWPEGVEVNYRNRARVYVPTNTKVSGTLPTPMCAGYGFIGWSTSETSYVPFDYNTIISKSMDLYAVWGAQYSVTFDANGGTGSMSAQTFTSGVAQPLTANSFTRDGYAFAGWNTKANGTGTAYTDKENVSFIANTTLYAQWKENTAEPTATATPTPTATATLEPGVTATPTPTATATLEPGATATPTPTVTVTLEPGATATPTPTVESIVILQQPQDFIGQEGQQVDISVVAKGEGLSYQWYVNRNDGKGFVPCENAGSASHTTTPLKRENDGYRYYCEITSKDGSLRTDTVTLTVKAAVPKTGDNAHLGLWLTMMAMSLASMAFILHQRKQSN